MAKTGTKTRVSERTAPIIEEKTPERASTADAVARDLGGKSAPESADQPEITRVSVPVDVKTGKIAFERMRGSTRDDFMKTLSISGVSVGSDTSGGGGDDAAMNSMLVDLLYTSLGTLAAMGARTRGFHQDDAKLMMYSEQEKAAFAKPTLKVLEKYNLMGGKYADEIALALLVGVTTAGHVQALTEAAAKRAPKVIAAAPLRMTLDTSAAEPEQPEPPMVG